MQMIEGAQHARGVEPRVLLAAIEALALVHRVQLTSECGLHQEVDRLLAVVGLIEPGS